MTAVICYIALQTLTQHKPTRWVGQLTGLSIDSKVNRNRLYVDFSKAIAAKHLVLAEGQPMVFRVNDNSCNYIGEVRMDDNARTEAGLK